MKWLRLYDDLLDDPKAQQLPPALFKHWINLLCLASKTEPRGTLPAISDVAFRLRLNESKASSILKELLALGLLDRVDETLRPHNWEGRQRMSDNVADRVRKHRLSVTGNDSVTLQKRSVDTDTDTERDLEPEEIRNPPYGSSENGPEQTEDEPTSITTKGGYTDEFESFWDDYPRDHGIKSKAFAEWKRLTKAERIAAKDSLPAFRLGDRWQRGYILDCHRWLKDKAFETPPLPWSLPINELPPPLKKRVDNWIAERTNEQKPILPYPEQLAADIADWRNAQRLGAA